MLLNFVGIAKNLTIIHSLLTRNFNTYAISITPFYNHNKNIKSLITSYQLFRNRIFPTSNCDTKLKCKKIKFILRRRQNEVLFH